jgi:hypothetical protein
MKGFRKKRPPPDDIVELIRDFSHDKALRNALIKDLVESGCHSKGGLQYALETHDLELANYLWENNDTLQSHDLKNICYCMETLRWAHKHHFPFDDQAINIVTNIWNAHEVHDRLMYLFKECRLQITNNDTWNRIRCRHVAYLGFRYCTPCKELRDLVEMTCDIGAMHICCVENGFNLTFDKCLGGLTSYNDLVILCQYTDVYVRDVLFSVLTASDILEKVIVDILTNTSDLVKQQQQNLFDWFIENNRFKAAKYLGTYLIKPDWKKWITRSISQKIAESSFCEVYDIYLKDIKYYVRYKLMDQREGNHMISMLQSMPVGFDDYETFKVEQCEISERRRRRLLCLCAHRFDKQSAFSLLSYDLICWIMKNYV